MIFLRSDMPVYRVSQLNCIRTTKCFTWRVVSRCVLDLTTSPVLISMSVSHCVFWLPIRWLKAASTQKCRAVCSRRVSGCCDGQEWDALKDQPWHQQDQWRKVPEGRQRDRCCITSLHNTQETLRCIQGSWQSWADFLQRYNVNTSTLNVTFTLKK